MLTAIVHHGYVNDNIEYFATVVGPDLDRKFFSEQIDDTRGKMVRYFGGGSEVVLSDQGVSFHGNGGNVGEYMFGGHFPVQDLLNDQVVNRLVLFGGIYDRDKRELSFTPHTSGFESYEDLFFHGNAVANHFFFLDDRASSSGVVERQEKTLRTIGRLLKRSRRVGGGNFLDLAHEIVDSTGEPGTSLYLLRIVHRTHQRFYDECRTVYAKNRSLSDLAETVRTRSTSHGIDAYQRERIQIDVIYHHPENQELIDEYKRVLAASTGGTLGPSERARLMRLRTLSLRNDVPLSIFDTLEEIVLQDGSGPGVGLAASEEPDYIQSTRETLEGFLLGKTINKRLSPSDIIQLIDNKQKAVSTRNQTFEEILLDTGRLIDERALEEEDFERLESFGELITLFDRFDHTMSLINRLAFMDDVELSQEQVRSMIGNMHVFEGLRRGLFQAMFIDPIVSNEYTLSYGRRKLFALVLGLIAIDNNEATIADLTREIRLINEQEKAYFTLYNLARRRMATFYLELNTAEGRETFRREIAEEVTRDPELRDLQELITESLIEEVITKIRLEAFYINQLLPTIIEGQDTRQRHDFLLNSGLDRFQVEELESEYFEMRSLPLSTLESIRSGTASTS